MSDPSRRSSADRVVTDVERLVLDMLPHRISSVELARKVGVQPAELRLAFMTARGVSLYSALLRLRLTEADRLIRSDPNVSAEAAALLCGFGHYGVFHREFRSVFGREPSDPPEQFQSLHETSGR